MKLSLVVLMLFLSLGAIASEKLELGLYLPENGGSCAYQIVEQNDDTVVIIFRQNPTVVAKDPCAVGADYVIKADIVDSRSFIDVRTNRRFDYFSKY